MKRWVATLAIVASTVLVVGEARQVSAQFLPARAAELTATPSTPAFAPAPSALPATLTDTLAVTAVVENTSTSEPQPAAPSATDTPVPAPIVVPTVAPRTPVATVVATPAPSAPALSCPAGSWFCYPRLGISGAIVPYSDCSGQTDVGTQIRSFACLSDHYLMGHAYTQFGKLTGWKVGDTVVAYGQTFTVTGAFVQTACSQPRLPLAPLEMQTSLTANSCGDVLVVQAR
ncbi:MAG TPA: hypothetical protein VI814_09710 [Candidatus Limnocylindria bacterium]